LLSLVAGLGCIKQPAIAGVLQVEPLFHFLPHLLVRFLELRLLKVGKFTLTQDFGEDIGPHPMESL
ncbi:hypothetical protein WMY93_029874, partial [Mugilogobius chulae]